MADPMDGRPRAFGDGFLSQASVKDSICAASSDRSSIRYDARQKWSKLGPDQN